MHMSARHYACRRLNPYRGMTHIIDLGDSLAQTHDGLAWHLRAQDGNGWMRPVGVWAEGEGLKAGSRIPAELRDALEHRPPLPFPPADRMELWLLDKAQGRPLALLDSELPSRFRAGPIQPEWHPFILTYTGFRSPTLTRRDQNVGQPDSRHRDWLSRLVNNFARPYPAAQWFRRQPDGSGEGLAGLRLPAEWQGRSLPAAAFPELLVREDWNNPLEQSVISDYHTFLSPLLLLLPGLSDATRERMEAAACQQPGRLYRIHRLIPRVLDAGRLNAALVAARLEAAGGSPETDMFDY